MSNSIHGFILAAGYGKRMRVLSDPGNNYYAAAKPALPVGRRSILRHQLYLMREMGINKVVIAVKHRAETILRSMGDTSKFGLEIEIFDMNEKNIEDWGAAWTVYRYLEEQTQKPDKLVVLNGDILWDKNIAKPFISSVLNSSAMAQIVVTETPWLDIFGRFGTVQLSDPVLIKAHQDYVFACREAGKNFLRITQARMEYTAAISDRLSELYGQALPVSQFVEKPKEDDFELHVGNLANVGIFGIDSKVFGSYAAYLGEGFADFEHNLFQQGLLSDGKPFEAFVAPQDFYWRDIGTPLDLLEANFNVLDRAVDAGPQGREIKPGVWIGKEVKIPRSVLKRIIPPVIIGDQVRLEKDVNIGPYVVVGEGWVIKNGSRLAYSLLLPSYYEEDQIRMIGPGSELSYSVATSGRIGAREKHRNEIIVVDSDGIVHSHSYNFQAN